jgi:DNA-binding HxlR family transcriptional regulator
MLFIFSEHKITYIYLQKVTTLPKVSSNLQVSINRIDMKAENRKGAKPTAQQCTASLGAVADAIYAIGGKWKLRIIIALSEGNKRFNELQRRVEGISAKVLSNELKDLELNGFIKRTVYTGMPVVVEYELTEYSNTLHDVMRALSEWGAMHRETIKKGLHTIVPN